MSIQVTCLQCGTSCSVNESLAGRRVRCPQCDSAVHVPEQDATIVPVEAMPGGSDIAQPVGAVAVEPVEAAVPVSAVAPAATDAVPEHRPVQSVPVGSATLAHPMLVDDDEDDEQVFDRKPREEEELDMTPMVDVTFLLLIFFMVTAAFSLQKSINMPRQQTDQPSTAVVEEEQDELDLVEIEVDEFGSFLVLAPDWERETPGKQNLITALKEAIAGNTDGMRLVIKVHELAKLRYLVDAMDAGTIAGYSELQVTQVEEFD